MVNTHAERRTRRWQFTLPQMLLIMALLCIGLIWQLPKLERRWERQRAAQQKAEAIAKIKQLKAQIKKIGGNINTSPVGSVTSVVFFRPETVKSFLNIEDRVDGIQQLGWPESDSSSWHIIVTYWDPKTEVTDDHLASLRGLKRLRKLTLIGARVNVTEAGFAHLTGLKNLQLLKLGETKVTDSGLKHLEGLTKLRRLKLPSQVTDEGVKKLRKMLPFSNISRER